MLNFLLVILGLSILVIVHELGHFLAAKTFKILVEEFGIGLPPRLWGKKIGETLYSINWLPLGGFVRLFGENRSEPPQPDSEEKTFYRQSIWKRILVVASGVLMNFLAGWLMVSTVFFIGIPTLVAITDVKSGSLAETAGIKRGDILLNFKAAKEVSNFVNQRRGQEIYLKIKRGSETLEVPVTPRLTTPEGEGNLGIYLIEGGVPKTDGAWKSLWLGLTTSLKITAGIAKGIALFLASVFVNPLALEGFIGPIGIVNTAAETTRIGIIPFIQLLSLISLNLAVFNLFPIPALDGGRLLFLLIEKIRGQALRFQTEALINAVGMAILITLMILVTAKDILTLL